MDWKKDDRYSEITSEHMIRATFCDLAVKIDGALAFLIEVKAIGLDLKDQHLKQCVDYAATELVTVHYIPGGDRSLESAYDRFGNRKSLVFTDGADVMNHEWTYDKLNRLVEAELASPNPLEFTYFANDDLETM